MHSSVTPFHLLGRRQLQQLANHLDDEPADEADDAEREYADERQNDQRCDNEGVEGEHSGRLGRLPHGIAQRLELECVVSGLGRLPGLPARKAWLRDSGSARDFRLRQPDLSQPPDQFGRVHECIVYATTHSPAMPRRIIRSCIVHTVKAHLLIKELVEEAGGSLPVAKAMKAPGFQPTLHKFISGNVDSPSRSTAERIARHFNLPVDAIYDDKIATQIAADKKLAISHGNVDTQAQRLSPPVAEDARTASAVGGGQQTISPDEVFKAMSVRERVRFARLLSAAFDDPPEIGVTVEGELWVMNYTNSGQPLSISTEPHARPARTVKRASK